MNTVDLLHYSLGWAKNHILCWPEMHIRSKTRCLGWITLWVIRADQLIPERTAFFGQDSHL
jgi:hypothetical protein